MEFGDISQLLRALAALAFVLALMGGLTLVLKKLGLSGALPTHKGKKRLKIVEILPLDGRRKLAIIQRDDVQHLILLGGNEQTIIETGFKPDDNKDHA
ncbi:MAG: flagellar biosynthetic protein FliO [Bdellovibrionales bacterium]